MSSKTKRHSTSSTYGKKSQPIDLVEDQSSMSSDDGSDSAQPVRPSKKKGGRKSNDSDEPDVNRILKSEGSEEEDEEEEEEENYEVSKIKAHRVKRGQTEYQVGWKNYESDDDSWEPESNLAGAKELLRKYKLEHDIGSKPKSARNSTISSKSTNKKPRDADEDKQPDSTAKKSSTLKRKRDEETTKGSIAPLRKNGFASKKKDVPTGPPSEQSGSPQAEADCEPDEPWEDHVKHVITIERHGSEYGQNSQKTGATRSGEIRVLLQLKSNKTAWVSNSAAREKVPMVMLDFYEKHLQFAKPE
ncbi:uncharacterized protein MELLADRAFT_116047 [Melampsora larici-populina 98AG31]|uniref:Chromo domain-containing protein n=1 Tax=Melampsora larici-populina (strain 98AG31 / pathotype 3-4-7) TaxID=747676 RepID=F4RHF1_MELLP|nr:uncharacterized protein MELLADRAFT_116047 [Melampsora larici-populina 98AG31]EGG08158.1 hypothetical protein MELLADRAFT_116047 [Melampsora larici-populina 98AG31]